MPDFIKCPTCQELFNPAYLDQLAKHMHTGFTIDETFKGEIVAVFDKHNPYLGSGPTDELIG